MPTLNDTPSADRVLIGFFGVRNAGKSSLINAVTGQDLAVVSDVAGTTTDPVRKAMELLPAGPVLIIDTPGIDDEGDLGELRVRKARRVLNSVDVAVLAVDATRGPSTADRDLISLFGEKHIPFVVALTKCDRAGEADVPEETGTPSVSYGIGAAQELARMCGVLNPGTEGARSVQVLEGAGSETPFRVVRTSAVSGAGIHGLKEAIAGLAQRGEQERFIVSDLLSPGDCVVLVCPIDESAPKGRLILPQQQTIRDIIDAGCIALVAQDSELEGALSQLANPPRMVVTDSQVFATVSKIVPASIPLTSFSILMARYKGTLDAQVEGAAELDRMRDGEAIVPRILMAEGCTHHRQCEDIGTVKLPNLVRSYTGKEPVFDFSSGNDYPDDLSAYDLVIHCGGCMVNEREMHWRARHAAAQAAPFTNYGIAIAKMTGILDRSLAPLQT